MNPTSSIIHNSVDRVVQSLQTGGYQIGKVFNFIFNSFNFTFRANEGGSCSPELENVTFDVSSNFDLTTNQRIGIYGGIVLSAIIITISKAVFSYITCLNASRNLHNKMFKAILRAPILFFDTNPVGGLISITVAILITILTGRVLNRFSADTGLLDIILPNVFFLFFTVSFYAYVLLVCIYDYSIDFIDIICYNGGGMYSKLLADNSLCYQPHIASSTSALLSSCLTQYTETRSTW